MHETFSAKKNDLYNDNSMIKMSGKIFDVSNIFKHITVYGIQITSF